jgi:hypothetical protein
MTVGDPTADVNVTWKPTGQSHTYAEKIADGVTLYRGTLVGLEGGYLNRWAGGADDVFVGICTGEGIGIVGTAADGSGAALLGNTSATPIPEAKVNVGYTLTHLTSVAGTPTQAKVGDPVYCGTSNVLDLTLTSTGTDMVGWLSRYTSATDVDVTLFTPSEYIIQNIS